MANTDAKEKLRKKLKTASPTEVATIRKDIAGLEDEEITAMGQENDTQAAHAVIEVDNEQEALGRNIHLSDLNYLQDAIKQPNTYRQRLMEIADRQLEEEQFSIPKGFGMAFWQNPTGMGLVIKREGHTQITRQFKYSYDPVYDKAAIEVILDAAFALIDYTIRQEAQRNGIYLPKQSEDPRRV